MSDQEQKPLVPPVADKKREIARGVAEATLELIPGVGSFFTKILQVVVPPKVETDCEAWQEAISELTNQNTGRLDEHERLINPTTTLTGTVAQLAVALAEACPDGLGHQEFDLGALCKLLPEMDQQDIEDAIADLEVMRLVERERFLGKHWVIRLMPDFYVQLDRQIMGWDNKADAVTVARLLLERDASGDASDLHRQTGWEKRRFNPAFRIVLDRFPESRISQQLQPDYPSAHVLVLPEDRAVLRRLVNQIESV
jgi:hypothetical protein